MKVAKARKAYREEGYVAGLESFMPAKKPLLTKAMTKIVFFHDVKRNRDADNALHSLKAGFDGIADSGLIVNDSGLRHQPIEFATGKPMVVIEFEEIKDGTADTGGTTGGLQEPYRG